MSSNTANQLLKYILPLTTMEQVFSFVNCYNQFDNAFLQEYFKSNYEMILENNQIFTIIQKLRVFLGIDTWNISERINDIETSKNKFVYVYPPTNACLRCHIRLNFHGSIVNANLYSIDRIASAKVIKTKCDACCIIYDINNYIHMNTNEEFLYPKSIIIKNFKLSDHTIFSVEFMESFNEQVARNGVTFEGFADAYNSFHKNTEIPLYRKRLSEAFFYYNIVKMFHRSHLPVIDIDPKMTDNFL